MAEPGRFHSLPLGHGLELRAGMGDLDGSVSVAVAFRDEVLFHDSFGPDGDRSGFRSDHEHVRADGEVDVDPFAGEIRMAGHLSVRIPGTEAWHELVDVDGRVLARFAPAIGSVGGSPEVHEPVVDHPRFGRSQLCTPAILRIHVEDGDRLVAEVGRLVKRRMFADHPPFVFNTVACVGRAEEGRPGLYPDPESIWFNVFFGFYQLDCPKSEWERPFGYRTAAGSASELEAEDVVRLGKSDWNWFSNWMYGVPIEAVEPYSAPDAAGVEVTESGLSRIGRSLWHGMTLHGVEVASTYESPAPGALRLTTNTVIDDVWRRSFGLPAPSAAWPESFVSTRLVAQVDMAYWEDDDAFHTVIFGGTAAIESDPEFLAAQMAAVREVIARTYPELGFATG